MDFWVCVLSVPQNLEAKVEPSLPLRTPEHLHSLRHKSSQNNRCTQVSINQVLGVVLYSPP
jgi:hypothetical protein